MRKTVIPLLAVFMFVGATGAVVGADCPPGQPCIMSSGGSETAETSEPVEKSDSGWNATLQIESIRPSGNITERLLNSSYGSVNSSYSLEFDGVMRVNSGCYRPDFEITGSGQDYTAEIVAVRLENKTCTQAITEISYSFEFESNSPYTLEVSQGNISERFEHPGLEEQSEKDSQDRGLVSRIFNWFSNLF